MRFELNDEKGVAAWLADSIAAHDGDGDTPEYPAEISASYDPLNPWDDQATATMISAAGHAGVITGPGTLIYDTYSDTSDPGYAWLVYLDGPDAPQLTSGWQDARHIAGRGMTGAEAALEVLREGVAEGNRMLDNLAAYVAARS